MHAFMRGSKLLLYLHRWTCCGQHVGQTCCAVAWLQAAKPEVEEPAEEAGGKGKKKKGKKGKKKKGKLEPGMAEAQTYGSAVLRLVRACMACRMQDAALMRPCGNMI